MSDVTEMQAAIEANDFTAVRHRLKRLHELGPNHEHFKLGDMDCEVLLAAYDKLKLSIKQSEYKGWADCCDEWMAPGLAKENKELKHAELGL